MLRQQGWRVLRVWEHDLSRRREPALVRKLVRCIAAGGGRHTPAPVRTRHGARGNAR